VSEKDAKELVSGWAKRAGEGSARRIQQQVDETVRRALEKMGLSQRADVDKLEARIAELERRVPRRAGTPG